METAALLVALTAVVLAGVALADRVRAPAPLLLIAVGIAGSYLPAVPTIHLEPEVVLLGLLPPLLYSAAIQTSLIDFAAHRRPILLLSIGLVVATTITVGAVVQWLLPGLGWAGALAIGAVVAPPDAVAASAIARRIGLARPIVTVLEGESLLNDATALVALRSAIVGMAAAVSAPAIGLDFVRAAGGGALSGFVVFLIVGRLRRRITDPLLDTSVSFVTPYAAYLLAEGTGLHASGVIAVVVAGLLLGHKAPIIQTAQSRITERTTWGTIAFLLENAVFLLIGLQAKWIFTDVARSPLSPGRIALVCAATLAVVILTRLAWTFTARSSLLLTRARSQAFPWSYSFLIGWAGMRGVVTLAAAFVIPAATPHREVLLLIAFTVVAGTLFLQGLTLPVFLRRLDVPAPDPAADALARAMLLEEASRAGLARLAAMEADPHGVADLIRRRIEERNFAAWERLSTAGDEAPSRLYARTRLAMLEAERERVLQVRRSGAAPSEVVGEVLTMLDVEESIIMGSMLTHEQDGPAGEQVVGGQECPDLAEHPAEPAGSTEPVCRECVAADEPWVALRRCLTCGNVGCCDSSAGRHATAHFHATGHPVMQSAQPGEVWRWCYVHQRTG